MIPIYVLETDYALGSNAEVKTRTAQFTSNMSASSLAGPVIAASWDGGASLAAALAMAGDAPFILALQPMPIPAGVPTVQLHGQACGCFWTPEYLTAWQGFVDQTISTLMVSGKAPQLAGMRVCFVAPYAGDSEDGLFADDPKAGSDTPYDGLLAAGGYTPSGAISAHRAGFSYLADALLASGLMPALSLATLTPGNQPKVDDDGVVTKTGNGLLVPNGVIDALTAEFPNNERAICYDVFTGDAPPTFFQAAANTLGGLVIQMHGTDKGSFSAATFGAALAQAREMAPMWIEVHADQVAWLGSAGS